MDVVINDNCKGTLLKNLIPNPLELERAYENILKISNKTVGQLVAENPKLFVYPSNIQLSKDRIAKSEIIHISGSPQLSCSSALLSTNNLIGFVGINDTRLKIRSRFEVGNKDDFFLHYMLQRVSSFNLFDFKFGTDKENVFDLLLFIFPKYLHNALSQGLYKEFQRYEYNSSSLRGPIDVRRHICLNVPATGKIAFHAREYSFDNHVMQLVRHTIEYIKSLKVGKLIFQNEIVAEDVKCVIDATPSYVLTDRRFVIEKNKRPIMHPYYWEYSNLQCLCLSILLFEELKYGANDDSVYGVLLDGAWLWEEYINTVIGQDGFLHYENKLKGKRLHLFADPKIGDCYPDFVKEGFIIDAKYKKYEDSTLVTNIQREDLYQIISYMFISKARLGGVVFPSTKKIEKIISAELSGYGGNIALFGMYVPQKEQNYSDFCNRMEEQETYLRTIIQRMFKK